MTISFHSFIQDKILKLDSINSVNYREDSEMVPLMLCKNINTIITIMEQYIVFWLREIERSKSLKKKIYFKNPQILEGASLCHETFIHRGNRRRYSHHILRGRRRSETGSNVAARFPQGKIFNFHFRHSNDSRE